MDGATSARNRQSVVAPSPLRLSSQAPFSGRESGPPPGPATPWQNPY